MELAKIFNASQDGAQILFYRTTDDEGNPAIAQVTEIDGCFVTVTASYKEGQHDFRDEKFKGLTQEYADVIRAEILKSFG